MLFATNMIIITDNKKKKRRQNELKNSPWVMVLHSALKFFFAIFSINSVVAHFVDLMINCCFPLHVHEEGDISHVQADLLPVLVVPQHQGGHASQEPGGEARQGKII